MDWKLNRWFTEGLIIAGISLWAYIITVVFQLGYTLELNVPLLYLNIDKIEILLFGGLIILYFIYVFGITYIITRVSPIIKYVNLIAMVVAQLIFVFKMSSDLMFNFFFFLFITGLPILFYTRHFKRLTEEKKKDFLELVFMSGYIVVSFTLSCTLAFFAGSEFTKTKEIFLVDDKNELILIGTYHDNFVCMSFDANKKQLTGKIVFKKVDDKHGLSFNYKKIGPLKRVIKK